MWWAEKCGSGIGCCGRGGSGGGGGVGGGGSSSRNGNLPTQMSCNKLVPVRPGTCVQLRGKEGRGLRVLGP